MILEIEKVENELKEQKNKFIDEENKYKEQVRG